MVLNIPIINKGAVSPKACAIPTIVPVKMPGNASGTTWWNVAWIGLAPIPSAASRIDGGTARKEARDAIIIVGNVINDKTSPPTNGVDLGRSKTFKSNAKPSNPKTIDGTAAKLLILTSINAEILFFGANSSK